MKGARREEGEKISIEDTEEKLDLIEFQIKRGKVGYAVDVKNWSQPVISSTVSVDRGFEVDEMCIGYYIANHRSTFHQEPKQEFIEIKVHN